MYLLLAMLRLRCSYLLAYEYIERTASNKEIKTAYRKMALALHPDRHDGCQTKAEEFKVATEAYQTLSDTTQRNAHDRYLNGQTSSSGGSTNSRRRSPPPNYRKVYAPRPPPGFKVFNSKLHYDMHYGDGMENEAIERARKRAEAASGRMPSGYEYESPLGKGFVYQAGSSNPFAKRRNVNSKRRPKNEKVEYEFDYEEGYYDVGNSSFQTAKRVLHSKESVKMRMDERRKNRRRNRGDPLSNAGGSEEGCVVM